MPKILSLECFVLIVTVHNVIRRHFCWLLIVLFSAGFFIAPQFRAKFCRQDYHGLRIFDHISAGLRSFRWLNVNQRLMVNDAVIMHKCLQGLSDKFSTRATIHNRQTRYRTASIFHIVESLLASAPFITVAWKYGIT